MASTPAASIGGNAGSPETSATGAETGFASTWAITSSCGILNRRLIPVASTALTDSTRASGPSFSRMSSTASPAVLTRNL